MQAALDVSIRLRNLRLSRKMSQRLLARRSGVSNATISLIESGKMSPSVAVLKSVLDGLKMDLATFFAEESSDPEPLVYRSQDLLEIGQGKISFRQVGNSIEGRRIQILHERYAPGADTGKVSLHHAGEEGGVVICGELELTVDGERHVLGPGDAYYFESSRPHRARNIGTEECVIVSACSPPSV
ncbi:MAG: cupin domain-containing protein [Deltaproteobacteria bacterium]|nr:MAG: cupin domain-containing protein [Deltaproteobacteria bacterium]